tara:strand:+ start:399 stop:569 length:171 start_codon:yes stop_codon:yes gene_type:complete
MINKIAMPIPFNRDAYPISSLCLSRSIAVRIAFLSSAQKKGMITKAIMPFNGSKRC